MLGTSAPGTSREMDSGPVLSFPALFGGEALILVADIKGEYGPFFSLRILRESPYWGSVCL